MRMPPKYSAQSSAESLKRTMATRQTCGATLARRLCLPPTLRGDAQPIAPPTPPPVTQPQGRACGLGRVMTLTIEARRGEPVRATHLPAGTRGRGALCLVEGPGSSRWCTNGALNADGVRLARDLQALDPPELL